MFDLKWSNAEKRLARELFERALQAELQETVAEFKSLAAAVNSPNEMWNVHGFLAQRQCEIDAKYNYRYSQLLLVLSRLVREGRLREEQLAGLSEEKRSIISRYLSL